MSRRDRFLCMLVCAVFGLAGGMFSNLIFLIDGNAQVEQRSSVVQAQRFEVVDNNGRMLAVLGADKEGAVSLDIYSTYPVIGTRLGSNFLTINDHRGNRRIGIGAWVGGSPPSLNLYDDKGSIKWSATTK